MSTQIADRTSVSSTPRLSRLGLLTILGGVLQFIAGIGVEGLDQNRMNNRPYRK
jgi:hypothetical protein